MKIGILGFGNFGQFLCRTFVKQGHIVLAYSHTDQSQIANAINNEISIKNGGNINNITMIISGNLCDKSVLYVDTIEAFFAHTDVDVVLFSMSIVSFKACLMQMETYVKDGKRDVLWCDVLSVKVHAKETFLSVLPSDADVCCTHPMFGPESGRNGWENLPMVYDKVRIKNHPRNIKRCDDFLNIFVTEGCRMVELSCEEHDKMTASSQFITHTTGRMLANLNVQPNPIATKGFEVLLNLMENTVKDSFDLYYGLFKYNSNSQTELELMEESLRQLKEKLYRYNNNINSNNNNNYDNSSGRNAQSLASSQLCHRVEQIKPSKTVSVTSLATELKKKGRDIITLSVGEPDFPPVPEVKAAAIECIESNNTLYTAMNGLIELREGICKKLKDENNVVYTPDSIVVTSGGKQALLQAIMAICRPGDEVIIPAPYWVSYPDMCVLSGAKPIIINTKAENDYILQTEELISALSPRSRLLILCSPSNPTGSVMSESQVRAIASVIMTKSPQLLVISDEIYEYLIFDDEVIHFSMASIDAMKSRTMIVNGFSKGACMTGYRLGYLAAPKYIADAVSKIQSQNTTCASTISQMAGIAALKYSGMTSNHVKMMKRAFRDRRDYIMSVIDSIPTIKCRKPTGAFYCFPIVRGLYGKRCADNGEVIKNSEDLCIYLLRVAGVALVPGVAFGDDDAVRIAFAVSMETLKLAMERFKSAVLQLRDDNTSSMSSMSRM